ncbi:hypothetical protein IGI65_000043 [Enterococcus sp. DIV0755b]|uniref:hypothetical protein n=1 Tax=Enterococcus sp. DIV0755b TaxID=2774657 RepID=UPI003F239E73
MDYKDIYHVESIAALNSTLVNRLLHNGWILLGINQRADLSPEGIPESHVSMVLGASKNVYEKFNLENLAPKPNHSVHF